ncbi:hypothetical protein, partial [Paenibacillus periandrae]|uniref:hypothetical protein n=1 Tax=Paenibacillus periandrae TaxID=1761741 RepID=UPI001F0A0265
LSATGVIPATAKRARVHAGLASTAPNGSGTVYVDSVTFKYGTDSNIVANPEYEKQTRPGSSLADGWDYWKS